MSRKVALFLATLVSLIYGLTFTIAKDVMPVYIDAFGFILLRVLGATVLFWLVGLKIGNEKIEPTDFKLIILCSIFGVALNMLTFFEGLKHTSPINGAVLMVTTPIIVLIFSALILREKVTFAKVLGLLLGLTGTILLIAYGKKGTAGSNESWGNFLVFVNAVSYSFYLILVKKLMDKYNAFSFVKWIYLFGFLWVLPFGYSDVVAVNWQTLPFEIWIKIGFVIVFSTFVTYMLNLVTMRRLSPTLVAVFIYLQPVFASIYALSLGKDTLNFVKILSALLIFIGVYLVTVYKKNTN